MDDRSIDKAPSASLDMMALNKTVVNARSVVRKAKMHLINKLIRNVSDLKKKKGSEQQKEKNLKKAQRFLEEIDSMRTLKDDKIFKYALANVSKFEEIAKSTVSPSARAMARLADHRLVKDYVQKFRNEQSDWRDLAAFMLMKQTGRKFKNSKQKEKAKRKKERKDAEKVNRAENVKASKLMTEVYTHGLFRDDEFQKAKETLESYSKGELNFLQKRRLRLANEKKEKQKLKASEKKKSDSNDTKSKVKHSKSDDKSEGEDESEEDLSEKSEITKSKKINDSRVSISDHLSIKEPSEDDDEEKVDSDEDDDEEGDDEDEEVENEEEEMEVSCDGSENDNSEEQSDESNDEEEDDDIEALKISKVKKIKEKTKIKPLERNKTSEKDKKLEPLQSNMNNKKDTVEPLTSKKNSKDKVISSEKNKSNYGEKDTVVPLGSKKILEKNKECVVKQLNIGSMSDEEAESSEEEEKPKLSRKDRRSKSVPKFLTEEPPSSKKLPKDSFFEGGDFDSDSEDSEKDKSDEDKKESSDNDADSQDIVGHRGKIKSMIYNGGYRAGRGRGHGGRGRGGKSDDSFSFGARDKSGKNSRGRGRGGGDGPFSFGSKEVMYKRRNQTLITAEGKTKLVSEAETKESQSKPKLHPSWEASRKRKAEQSGGIKAFAGQRISFGDD